MMEEIRAARNEKWDGPGCVVRRRVLLSLAGQTLSNFPEESK